MSKTVAIDLGAGYRQLEPHEILREGDESGWGVGNWRAVIGALGASAVSMSLTYRSKIRIQSDGWRWLDEGEIILATDRWLMEDGRFAPPYRVDIGREAMSGEFTWRRRIEEPLKSVVEIQGHLKSPFIICACGHHDLDPAGDVYAQHREMSAFLGSTCVETLNHWHNGIDMVLDSSCMHRVRGIGVSAPQREVSFQVQGLDEDGV